MNIKVTLRTLVVASATVLISSCGGKNKKVIHSATGWPINSPAAGGYEVNPNTTQYVLQGLAFVEGGTFVMGRTQVDVMKDWNTLPRQVSVPSFFMDETEVTNIGYREYLFWLTRVYGESYPEVVRQALPDTLVWRNKLSFNEPMVNNYLRHPGFNYYPVVGVSWEQANDYCDWRTDRVNERNLIAVKALKWNPEQFDDDNFNTAAYRAGAYTGAQDKGLKDLRDPDNKEGRPGRLEDGVLVPGYRLPTEAEWEYAALSLIGNSIEGNVDGAKIYPWDRKSLRDNLKATQGNFFANFKRGHGDNMGTAGRLNDGGARTTEVKSFPPNDFGLYDMAGNVNEWVFDVYRPMTQDLPDFNPARGNVFTQYERDEEGYLAEVDSLGRIPIVEADANANRRQYQKADNTDFLDGDVESSIYYEKGNTGGQAAMYDFGTTSLMNNRVRVYKGGSWRDRAYWLTPGTRRFLNQEMAADDIGFRCVLDRMGSASIKTKKK